MKLTISKSLQEQLPEFSICAYTFTLIEKNDKENCSSKLTEAFLEISKKYQVLYQLADVVHISKLKQTREGYKKLGKDPSHTRPACEALIRRIIKGDSLYRLGDVIDTGNLISILTMKSVCVVDLDKIKGNIHIRIGTKDDVYEGIGRGIINVSNLPLYCDEISPFGNPTSDTMRTAITKDTENVLIMLIHFDNDFESDEFTMLDCLNTYLKIKNLNQVNVDNEEINEYDE